LVNYFVNTNTLLCVLHLDTNGIFGELYCLRISNSSVRDRDIWLFLFVRISSILLSPMNSCFTGLIQDRDIRAEPEFAHDSTVSGHCFDSIEKRTIQYTIMCTAHLTSSVIGRMRSRVL